MILFTLSAKKKPSINTSTTCMLQFDRARETSNFEYSLLFQIVQPLLKKNVLPDNIYWQLGVWYRCCSPEVEFCFDVTSKSFSCMFMMRTHLHIRLEHLPFSNFSVDPIINLIETNILFCTNKTYINGTTITTFPQLN